jgi:hypothetical protein
VAVKKRESFARPRLRLRTAQDDRSNKVGTQGRFRMQDAIFVAISVAFFVMSIAYVHFCERLK